MKKTFSKTSERLAAAQNGDAKLSGTNARAHERHEATLALLEALEVGNREIEQRCFRSAADVFADLEKEDA